MSTETQLNDGMGSKCQIVQHQTTLSKVGFNVLNSLLVRFQQEDVDENSMQRLYKEYWYRSGQFERTMLYASYLSDQDLLKKRQDLRRFPDCNPEMSQIILRFSQIYSPDAVIPGFGMKTVFTKQHAYIKTLIGVIPDNADIHDLLGNGASVNLGVGHPLVSILPILEQELQISGFKGEYLHPSTSSLCALEYLTRLHPYSSEGTVVIRPGFQVTTVAGGVVENICAYAEKQIYCDALSQTSDTIQSAISTRSELNTLFSSDPIRNRRLLIALEIIKPPIVYAIDGTCLGGIGSARGGTFDFTESQDISRGIAGGYVQKMLPTPIGEQSQSEFLRKIEIGIENKNVAGVVVEPVLGDGGIHALRDDFVASLISILRKGYEGKSIPLIIDATQTCAGRAGHILGIDHLPSLLNYSDQTVYILGKSISGGERPFAFSLTPEKIAREAYPLTHISTTGGRHALDAVATVMFLEQAEVQQIINHNADILMEKAQKYRVDNLLNGVKLHRGFELGPDGTTDVQKRLLIDHGILTGKVGRHSEVLRTNFGLLYDPHTFRTLAEIVCGVCATI